MLHLGHYLFLGNFHTDDNYLAFLKVLSILFHYKLDNLQGLKWKRGLVLFLSNMRIQ